MQYTLMSYLPGDGTDQSILVAYLERFPIGPGGTCAFCHGDPCAEIASKETHIAKYYKRNPNAVTCPMCDGWAS